MNNKQGFSLPELLIVVAIILIIATMAVPSLIRSRQMANEGAAVANLRGITTAQINYASRMSGAYGDFTDLVSDGLLDDRWNRATPLISSYVYDLTVGSGTYTVLASPNASSGRCSYATTEVGTVTFSTAIAGCLGTAGNPVQ